MAQDNQLPPSGVSGAAWTPQTADGSVARVHITEHNAPAFHLTDKEVLARRPHGKGAATITRSLAYASGTDAGNRNMDKAGRSKWNDEDYNVASEVTNRWMVFGGFLPPECYEQLVGKPFPYILGNDGSWIKRSEQP